MIAALARSLLARLLARRGDQEAGDVLSVALADPAVTGDSFVSGPLAVARVELGWLDGSLGELTDDAQRALDRADRAGHKTVYAELCTYLRRAVIDAPRPVDPPGPWAPTLARRWQEAANAWAALGERYERAVVLATAPDGAAKTQGLRLLRELGAVATIPAV